MEYRFDVKRPRQHPNVPWLLVLLEYNTHTHTQHKLGNNKTQSFSFFCNYNLFTTDYNITNYIQLQLIQLQLQLIHQK
jgi:hypothetical protein